MPIKKRHKTTCPSHLAKTNDENHYTPATILYINARSIRNKLTDLEVILKTGAYDFVLITETWLKDSDLSSTIVNTQHCGIIRNDRSTHGGGVAAIYNAKYADKIVVHNVEQAELLGFELLAFDFYVTSLYSICFVCVYLPPLGSMNTCTVNRLLKVLRRFMAKQEVYIIGDFNFSDYNTNNIISTCKEPLRNFLSFLEDHCLKQFMRESTHIAGNILDLIITSKPQNITQVDVIHPLTDTCDHNMIEIKLNINTTFKSTRTPKPNFYVADYTNINQYLSSIDWENEFAPCKNMNELYTKFLEKLHTTIKIYVPTNNSTHKPRLPKEIRRILRTKWKLYKKSKVDKSFKAAYKEQEKLYKNAIKNYRYNCEQKVLNSNSKKVLFNHIKNKLHSRHTIPPLKKPDDQYCLDSQSKADLLNKTFSKVFLNESTSSNPPTLSTSYSHITHSHVTPISPQDISHAIHRLKNSVSRTPDSIPSYFIKRTSSQLLKPLSILFNYSINTGQIPNVWKNALIVAIYKKGSKSDPRNYRPISLTSVVCRILERIIHSYIMSHIINNNIVSPAQHGFVPNRSTQTQQIDFLDQLTSSHDKKVQVEVVYLDFSKAFDKVSHPKLMHVLNHIKINHKLTTWIQNYLSGRTQKTLVDSSSSSSILVTSGVPQGSVLGPLLFIIFLQDLINTITLNCHNTTVYAFADDIKLVSTDVNDLQQALDIVSSWTSTWKLLLNADKSEHLTVRQRTTQDVHIGGQTIPKVKTVRDLGVTVSEDMQWNIHIEKIRSKAATLSYLLLRTFSSANSKLLMDLFKTYVRPTMEYNTSTWSPYIKDDIAEAESVQRKFTRRVCQKSNIAFSNYNDRLVKLNLESLKSRREKNDLILAYKIIHGFVDVDCSKHFNFNRFGGHNLRRHSLHIADKKPPSALIRHNFFSHRVINDWNALPSDVVTSPTLDIFKHRLKLHSANT